MKNPFANILAALALLMGLVGGAQAADYWPDDPAGLASCQEAVQGPGVDFYEKKHKNPAQPGKVLVTFSPDKPGCLSMYVTLENGSRGMRVVAVNHGSIIEQDSDKKNVWSECFNFVRTWITVKFGSKEQAELTQKRAETVVVQPGSVQIERVECDAKCQIVKICAEIGTKPEDKMTADGKWLCKEPDLNLLVTGNLNVKRELRINVDQVVDVIGSTKIPGANLTLTAERHKIDVEGTKCITGQCNGVPFGKVVEERQAKYCGIRTDTGHILVIRDQGAMQIVLNPQFVNGMPVFTSNPRAETFRKVPMAAFRGDCNAAQAAVEAPGSWGVVLAKLGLPVTCQPVRRISGPISRD